MEQRTFPRLDRAVGVVGLGTWQLGADWGTVSEEAALRVLAAAVDSGVSFLDTADVYGDGRSETLIGRFLRTRPDAGLTVAPKLGRRLEQRLVGTERTMAQFALRWVIDQPGVTVVIPGARDMTQVQRNAESASQDALSDQERAVVADGYDDLVRPQVHDRW